MTRNAKDILLVLEAGLFPDAATLDDALRHVPGDGGVCRQKINPDKMDQAAWDKLLGDILAARTILTL